ncbi:putative leucine-rich repeat receptor-like serine/threonine-protein kinase [Platanthera zijinensis]|uniref:Leucine-rich repeat receptor-like serine/threonine-protein kinase n=1 Tax=Platanthera zijinensis TaxID=2320716 RepID=A0AAP0B3H3_9ASPA
MGGWVLETMRERLGQCGEWMSVGTLVNGIKVAIKVLSSESTQGAKEFLSEIAAISDIVHENLVKLYGACIEGDYRILVYNYLENNSLAQTLLVPQ